MSEARLIVKTVDGRRVYSSTDVVELSGLTYRQLDYNCRSGRVTPSIARGRGSGRVRRWSVKDVVKLRLIQMVIPPDRRPPAWLDPLLALVESVELSTLFDEVIVVVEGVPRLMTLDVFAEHQPFLRTMTTVIACEQLVRGLIEVEALEGTG